MKVKALLTSLLLALLFSSCDPNSDKQVGNANRNRNSGADGSTSAGAVNLGGSLNSSGTPTDAPIDGGLSLLLLAGTAYGIKRARNAKQDEKEK